MYKSCIYNLITKKIKVHPLGVPKLHSCVVNTTNNDVIAQQKKIIDYVKPLYVCTNQYPNTKKAKNSISAFNIRKGQIIGTTVNLHKRNLFNFFKIFSFSVLPKIQKWEANKHNQIKLYSIFGVGLSYLNLWPFGIKQSNSGAFIQFIVTQKKDNGLLDFFASYYLFYNKKT